ncbi:MAG: CPBP family intramembrane metalloprotease [Deltaproteobacteria bacterium]|nr:CPBP family intramembrane metalloprotease [Deltaproteobacteria bacterium]
MDRRAIARELTLVYVAIAALTFAITRGRDIPPFDQWVHLAVGALFLLSAMRLAQREPGGMRRMGIDLEGVLVPPEIGESGEIREDGEEEPGPRDFLGLRELGRTLARAAPAALRESGFALFLALVIFPPFALGFSFYHGPSHPFTPSLPRDPLAFALAQILVVALPEEALFRGYFQTRLSDVFTKKHRILGTDVSLVALVIQSALFALVHFVVDGQPERLAVFFPGLLFGWVRARRGGIGAAILFHALSNLYADVLVRGWLG